MKQQLIILWAFLALAYSAAIDTTISPFETDEEITTFLPNYDDAEELTELDQGKKFDRFSRFSMKNLVKLKGVL